MRLASLSQLALRRSVLPSFERPAQLFKDCNMAMAQMVSLFDGLESDLCVNICLASNDKPQANAFIGPS